MNFSYRSLIATASEAALVILQKKIDVLKQISVINDTIHQELNWIKKTIKDNKDDKDRMKLQDQMIKFVAEVRKQMSTLLNVSKTLYNAEEVQAFQEIVLKAIEEADPATKEKIISELEHARSVRRAIRVP